MIEAGKVVLNYEEFTISVDTELSRFKRILGPELRGRKKSSQEVESFLKCLILNQMTKIGMPKSYPIEKSTSFTVVALGELISKRLMQQSR